MAKPQFDPKFDPKLFWNAKKVSVWYVKVSENQETAIYAISLFGSVVYVKVRVKERQTKNIFTWVLDPTIEKVGLSLDEVS